MALLPTYREIVDLIKKGSTLEAQEKIVELRTAALELEEETVELKKRVRELEAQLELSGKLVYEQPSYWLVTEDARDGPFCQVCKDKEKLLVRLQGGKAGIWSCHGCKGTFYDSTSKPPAMRQRRPINQGY